MHTLTDGMLTIEDAVFRDGVHVLLHGITTAANQDHVLLLPSLDEQGTPAPPPHNHIIPITR